MVLVVSDFGLEPWGKGGRTFGALREGLRLQS